jgi:anti-sigma factor RsiW
MNCKEEEAKQRIVQYLDNELSDQERAETEEHLSQCNGCRSFLSELRQTWDLLDLYYGIEPTESFAANTLAQVREEKRGARRLRILKTAAILAAACLLIALVIHYLPSQNSGSPSKMDPDPQLVESELIEELDLIEDLDLLEEYGEDLELAFESDLYDILDDEESL